MKAIFKQLIIDFHQSVLPEVKGRALILPQLPPTVRKAYVLTGMRRSGKTWSLYQQMHQLMQSGVSLQQIVYVNFEDDRLIDLHVKDMQSLLDAYYELYPNVMDNGGQAHFFLDEVHEVDGWEKFIRRLLDTESMTIYLSGSSAKMLSKEIATSLRGRTIVREIFPFSFPEYLSFKGVEISKQITTRQKALLAHHVRAYLQWGGFPETIDTSPELHRELLQGYIETVIYRDIVERHKISNVHIVKKLLTYCIQNSAARFSINKLYNTFKSQGFMVSKSSLYEFMEYFEDAYCIFSVSVYHFSAHKMTLTPKKIYPIDSGLITAYTLKQDYEMASRLETAVFVQLRHRQKDIYYYQTASGKEVDFMTLSPEGEMSLYQSTLSLSNENTRQREVSALEDAMLELKVDHATIVTMDEEDDMKVKSGRITVIPIWKFLLVTNQ